MATSRVEHSGGGWLAATRRRGCVHHDAYSDFPRCVGLVDDRGWTSTNEADHGGTAAAVVRVHAEPHHAGGGFILEAHGALASRAADDVEIHALGAGVGGDDSLGGGLRLDLHGGGTHFHVECEVVLGPGSDDEVAAAVEYPSGGKGEGRTINSSGRERAWQRERGRDLKRRGQVKKGIKKAESRLCSKGRARNAE